MIENGKISLLHFAILVFMFTLGSAVLLLPSIVVSIAKEAAWISVLLSTIAGILFVAFWARLYKRYPRESIIQYSDRILGKWLGKVVGILYILYLLYLSALVLRDLGDFVTTNVLIETPIEFVNIIFMIPVIYGAYKGLEVIARSSEVLLPWIILLFSITVFLLFKDIDLSKLLPIFPDGWQTPVKGMYPLLGFPISELVIFLIIIPFIKQQDQIQKYFSVSLITVGLFLTLLVLVCVSVLGVSITARSPFPVFELAKEIKIGKFFERVEVLVGGIWVMTIFVKLSFCFYAANLATAQLLHLKSFRITILPYGLLVTALSLIVYRNTAEVSLFIVGAYPLYNLFYSICIPAILLIVAKIRKI